MIIVGGPASNGIDEKLSEMLNVKLVKAEHKIFPDGESYIRIPESVRGEEVVIVQSTYYPQDKHLMELLLMIEAVKNLGASKIISIIPYLAYARQDRRFKDGEALSLKIVLNLIYESGSDELITVEPHKPDAVISYFKGNVKIVDPTPALAREIKKEVENPFVLAPDRGALERAERLAKELNSPYSHIEKERDRTTGEVRIKETPHLDLHGKDVVLIDDIISTGGTLAQASQLSYNLGARKVIAAATHVLLVNDAYDKLTRAGIESVIGTNTIKVENKNVKIADISDLIAVKL